MKILKPLFLCFMGFSFMIKRGFPMNRISLTQKSLT